MSIIRKDQIKRRDTSPLVKGRGKYSELYQYYENLPCVEPHSSNGWSSIDVDTKEFAHKLANALRTKFLNYDFRLQTRTVQNGDGYELWFRKVSGSTTNRNSS